jgi:PEP-CTERM motif-containing protein
MRAVGAALTLSCAMVFLPSVAFADHIDLHGAKQCLIDVGSSMPDDHARGGSVGRSPDVRDGSVGFSSEDTMAAAAADATFTRRSGLENSEHFANQGFPQVFADDRISFDNDDEIAFNDLGHGIVRQIIAVLQERHEDHGRESDRHDGDHGHHGEHGGGTSAPSSLDPSLGPNPILTPRPLDATANPEPASMLLIGTGLAGLFGFRRRLLP